MQAVTAEAHWIKTVGAPAGGDRRDGELHQVFGPLPAHFDLEPWDDAPDAGDARYARADRPPERNNGRLIWVYELRRPDVE